MVILLSFVRFIEDRLIKLYSDELPVSMNLVCPCLLLVGAGY
jgi:hypothetical protein